MIPRTSPASHAPLVVVHDEDDVGPVEHVGVDADERVGGGAGGSHVEVGALAEHALGGRAALAVLAADEEHAAWDRLRASASTLVRSNLSGCAIVDRAVVARLVASVARPLPRIATQRQTPRGRRRRPNATSRNVRAADERRRERRSVLLAGRHAAHLSVDAPRLPVRSDLHDEGRRHRTSGASAPAPAGRPAAISIPADRRSCSRPRTKRRRRARRARASRAATSGRSTPATTSTARRPTARSSRRSRAPTGYDAEATIAPDGLIVFTSVRDGDMEIYTMKARRLGREAADQPSRSGRRAVLLAGTASASSFAAASSDRARSWTTTGAAEGRRCGARRRSSCS